MDAISRDTTLPPTYAFRVAKAYNAAAPVPVSRVDLQSAKLESPASAARTTDQAQLEASKKLAGIRRLVAARVEGGIDFGTSSVRPAAGRAATVVTGATGATPQFSGAVSNSTGALPLYRHPADKNAAATAIDMGRRVDVQA